MEYDLSPFGEVLGRWLERIGSWSSSGCFRACGHPTVEWFRIDGVLVEKFTVFDKYYCST